MNIRKTTLLGLAGLSGLALFAAAFPALAQDASSAVSSASSAVADTTTTAVTEAPAAVVRVVMQSRVARSSFIRKRLSENTAGRFARSAKSLYASERTACSMMLDEVLPFSRAIASRPLR